MKTKRYLAVIFLTISLFLCVGCQYDKVGALNQVAAPDNTFISQEFTLPVTLAPGETVQYEIVGSLCTEGSFENKAIQLLLSGSTYGSVYWDFPYQSPHYSYVRAACKAGYVTINIDRIGIGKSSHPPGDDVTIYSNAYVVDQIIKALRSGQMGDVSFDHVILVGHSLGSTISLIIAEQYPDDIDGVILEGFLHKGVTPRGLSTEFYPANQDPRFSHLNLDVNYNTTEPGKRTIFYHLPNADQAVIEMDEETKETLTNGEIKSSLGTIGSKKSKLLMVPTLIIIGQFDAFFCVGDQGCVDTAEIVKSEQPFFSPETCLEVFIVPDSGHDINLHRNAQATFTSMLNWADQHVGANDAKDGVCNH